MIRHRADEACGRYIQSCNATAHVAALIRRGSRQMLVSPPNQDSGTAPCTRQRLEQLRGPPLDANLELPFVSGGVTSRSSSRSESVWMRKEQGRVQRDEGKRWTRGRDRVYCVDRVSTSTAGVRTRLLGVASPDALVMLRSLQSIVESYIRAR
jgi:hypothetical protein